MTHYEVLGVERTASAQEIRRVYLDLARRHHPDYHQGSTDTTRVAAQRRMQRINEAWGVLGDPERRRVYDRDLGRRAVVDDTPKRVWRPIEDDDGDGADEVDPRDLVDDHPIGDGSRPPRLLTLAPAVLGGMAVAAFSLALVTRLPGLLALALIATVLAGLTLVAAPFIALAKSWHAGADERW